MPKSFNEVFKDEYPVNFTNGLELLIRKGFHMRIDGSNKIGYNFTKVVMIHRGTFYVEFNFKQGEWEVCLDKARLDKPPKNIYKGSDERAEPLLTNVYENAMKEMTNA